jgi:hypothetical protein
MHPPRLQAASTAIEFLFQLGSGFNFLACNVQDRVDLVWIFLQRIDSFGCRRYGQSDFAAMRFALHLFHDRHGAMPVSITSRRHFQGMSSSIEGGVCPKAARNFLDGFFFALADVAPVDHASEDKALTT